MCIIPGRLISRPRNLRICIPHPSQPSLAAPSMCTHTERGALDFEDIHFAIDAYAAAAAVRVACHIYIYNECARAPAINNPECALMCMCACVCASLSCAHLTILKLSTITAITGGRASECRVNDVCVCVVFVAGEGGGEGRGTRGEQISGRGGGGRYTMLRPCAGACECGFCADKDVDYSQRRSHAADAKLSKLNAVAT